MKNLFFILGALFVLNGCQRENSILEQTMPVLDPQVSVFSGLVGQISDEYGLPIENASVILGEYQTSSNELGVFEFTDILIPENGAYVKVEKDGFFRGSRSFSTKLKTTPYVKIELLDQTVFDIAETSQGGVIEIENAEIELPAGEYRLKDGSKYSGEIIVYARYLDPTIAASHRQMPGSLTGIDVDGEERGLGSYGMLGVELRNLSGEYLDLPEGTQAEIKIHVPNILQESAPGIIPLWHFDETIGSWVEEGEASLVGDNYVAQVDQFSFWNCNVPFDLVELTGFIQINGQDNVGGELKIIDVATGLFSFGVTGESGFFTVMVPKDRALLFELLGLCGQVVYEENLGSLSMDTDLATYDVVSNIEQVVISGILDNCGAGPIESGYVVVMGEDVNLTIPVESNGSFYTEIPGCGNEVQVEIYGFDSYSNLYGFPEIGILDELTNVILLACDEFYEPEYNISYEGQNWNPMGTIDSTYVDFGIEGDSLPVDFQFTMTLVIKDASVYEEEDGIQCIANFTINPDSEEVSYKLLFESQGFWIEGICQKVVEMEGPFESYIFSDITDNIFIVDEEKYPDNVPNVSFHIRI